MTPLTFLLVSIRVDAFQKGLDRYPVQVFGEPVVGVFDLAVFKTEVVPRTHGSEYPRGEGAEDHLPGYQGIVLTGDVFFHRVIFFRVIAVEGFESFLKYPSPVRKILLESELGDLGEGLGLLFFYRRKVVFFRGSGQRRGFHAVLADPGFLSRSIFTAFSPAAWPCEGAMAQCGFDDPHFACEDKSGHLVFFGLTFFLFERDVAQTQVSAALSFEEFEPSVGLIDVYFYGFSFGEQPFDPSGESFERTFWKEFRVSAKQDAGAGAEDRMGWIEIARDFFALQVGVSVADQGDHLQDKQIHGVRKD